MHKPNFRCMFTYFIVLFILSVSFLSTSFAQLDYVVRVTYFHPNDRPADPEIVTSLNMLIKDMQNFFAEEMARHGFGRKTFRYESDTDGNLIVHQVKGAFNDEYYQVSTTDRVFEEIGYTFDDSKNIDIFLIDLSSQAIHLFGGSRVGGLGLSDSPEGGFVVIPASVGGEPYTARVSDHALFDKAVHELGHAFGLQHDFRTLDIMSYGGYTDKLSACAAGWLDVHRYFNVKQPAQTDTIAHMKLLSAEHIGSFRIRFRFEIVDPDGIHQAQLLAVSIDPGEAPGNLHVLACESLSGERRSIVEFVIDDLSTVPPPRPVDLSDLGDENVIILMSDEEDIGSRSVVMRLMDVKGDFTQRGFAVNVSELLPQGENVSIPDPVLAALVRETLRLEPDSVITQRDMHQLASLWAIGGRKITDLSGLEHAIRLKYLYLSNHDIEDITPLRDLTALNELYLSWTGISDLTPLAKMTQLERLYLASNQIQDISPLANLTALVHLYLDNNEITDITHLSKMTNLYHLQLHNNQIVDVSPLMHLTKLQLLYLGNNDIRDVSVLSNMLHLDTLTVYNNPYKNRKPLYSLLRSNPGIQIYVAEEGILPVTLSSFKAEQTPHGVVLNWITESEVDNAGFYIYRSQTKDGEFKVVSPTIIQGAGTTGQRNEYTWTDTTAKPNTIYYYQIEDVSHAGVRKKLATVRLRGFVAAKGKRVTTWADVKGTR